MRPLPIVLVPFAVACFVPREKPPPAVSLTLGSLSLSATTPYWVEGVPFAGGGTPIELTARLQRGSFAGAWTPVVSVTVTASGRRPPVVLQMSSAPDVGPDVFEASLATLDLPDGPCRLVAMADGASGASWTSPAVSVTIDNTPPNVELQLPALGSSPLPRDFSIDAYVRADDGAGSGVVAFGLVGSGVPHSSEARWPVIDQANAPGPGALGRARVSGLDLALESGANGGLQGAFELTAAAVDGVGNVGTASLTVPVTRVRWTTTGPSFTTSPVLSRHGRILVGDAQGGLEAYEPDGSLAWSRTLSSLPLTATPAILEGEAGLETAFVPLREGRLLAIDVATGAPAAGFTPVVAVGFPTAAALDPRTGVVVAAAADGSVVVADLTGHLRSSLPPAPAGRRGPTSVSLAGAMGVIGGADGAVLVIEDSGRGPLTLLDDVLQLPGTMADGDGNAAAFFGGSVWLSGLEGAFAVPDLLGGAAPVGPAASTTGAVEVGAVVDGDGTVFVAGTRALAQLRPGGLPGYTVSLATPPANAPTLGSDGTVYVATIDGSLRAVRSGGALGWATALARAPVFASAPMIDACRPTLYFAESDGRVGRLHALVIDSAGLDTRPAAWPHFRHDYQGSGNAQTVGQPACGP